jgi:hypothetical protein
VPPLSEEGKSPRHLTGKYILQDITCDLTIHALENLLTYMCTIYLLDFKVPSSVVLRLGKLHSEMIDLNKRRNSIYSIRYHLYICVCDLLDSPNCHMLNLLRYQHGKYF